MRREIPRRDSSRPRFLPVRVVAEAVASIWLSAQPTDLRKSFDSLASIVRDALGGDPLSGNIFRTKNE